MWLLRILPFLVFFAVDVALGNRTGSQEADHLVAQLDEVRASKDGREINDIGVSSNEVLDGYADRRREEYDRKLRIASNACAKVRCKSGKECMLDEKNSPKCVCIQECPDGLTLDDAVCGSDNRTYESECALRKIKCLGSQDKKFKKKLRRLRINYLGPCKELTSCKKSELVEYPTRMRAWLKNVFLDMYDTPAEDGGLTEKQRYHGRKVYTEREKLQDFEEASHDIMEREFEKFYPLYRYPIHWKFAKLDRRPKDKYLNKRELEPLRAPLIPMEHCTKSFFKKADKNKDKRISLQEWGQALGLENADIDPRLAF